VENYVSVMTHKDVW